MLTAEHTSMSEPGLRARVPDTAKFVLRGSSVVIAASLWVHTVKRLSSELKDPA